MVFFRMRKIVATSDKWIILHLLTMYVRFARKECTAIWLCSQSILRCDVLCSISSASIQHSEYKALAGSITPHPRCRWNGFSFSLTYYEHRQLQHKLLKSGDSLNIVTSFTQWISYCASLGPMTKMQLNAKFWWSLSGCCEMQIIHCVITNYNVADTQCEIIANVMHNYRGISEIPRLCADTSTNLR